MTNANSTSESADTTDLQTTLMDMPVEMDDLDDDTLGEIIENIRIDAPEGEMPLKALMLDLVVAHKELEQYKASSLAITQILDERIQEEKAAGNDDAVTVLTEVKKTAYGVYLRLHRGDAELTGDRDGKYDDYFDTGDPNGTA